MSEKKRMKKIKKRRVTFQLEMPRAEEVNLLGNFNHWEPGAHPMKERKDGLWARAVMLEPGRYEYKFLVDGRWQNDPGNPDFCENRFGSVNNVLTVC